MTRRNPTVLGRLEKKFVPLEDLTEAEILELPFGAFLPDELRDLPTKALAKIITKSGVTRAEMDEEAWEALTEDEQELVYENDTEREEKIEKLVDLFVDPYKRVVEDPDAEWIEEAIGDDGFHAFLQENADHLVDQAEDHHQSDINEIVNAGWHVEGVEGVPAAVYSNEEVRRAIDRVMQDSDRYKKYAGTGDYYDSDAIYVDHSNEQSIYIQGDDVAQAIEHLDDQALERAVKQINKQTNNAYRERWGGRPTAELTVWMLHEKKDFEAYVPIEYFVAFVPDWTAIENGVSDALDELFPDGPAGAEKSEEELEAKYADYDQRIVYRWPDGFYVLDLTPRELFAEGDEDSDGLNFCIGKPQFGYLKAVKRGEAKAYSLRTPSGRPKITLFVAFEHGTAPESEWLELISGGPEGGALIRGIPEVKGKSNRLLGWDLDKAGQGKIKQDETAKVFEFIALYLKYPLNMVPNIAPALKAVQELDRAGDPWAVKLMEKLKEHVHFRGGVPRARSNPPPRAMHTSRPAACGLRGHTACGGGGFCTPYKGASS